MDVDDHEKRSRRPIVKIGSIVYPIGWIWPIILASLGVGSDAVRIDFWGKLIITVVSIGLPVLLARYGGEHGSGCSAFLSVCCGCLLVVLWFWN